MVARPDLDVRLACRRCGLFLPRPVHDPFGVEGYRAIAHEIVADLGRAPAAVLFPCARGNGLYGAWKGFAGLTALPDPLWNARVTPMPNRLRSR